MKELEPLLDSNCLTVTTKSVRENLRDARNKRAEVIHPITNPISEDSGLAVLSGNLAPSGAVCKKSAVDSRMLRHSGPAKVFDVMEKALSAITDGSIRKGDVAVIRYEGPRGGPGMREMLGPTSAIVGAGLADSVALITDGRFSGVSRAACIGQVCPEAANGGPIAVVRDEDIIQIDIPNRSLSVEIPREELANRLEHWSRPAPKVKRGYLMRYSRLVSAASEGAMLK